MRVVLASAHGIVPETQCYLAWEALTTASAAHYAATGEPTMIYLDQEGDYWSQYLGGNPLRPVSGYTGIRLRSGCHVGGLPGARIVDMPAEAGGKPGQLIGVRLNATPVENVGVHNIAVSNRQGITSQNETFHAIWFHSSLPTATIRDISITGVDVDGVHWGDGIYFGQGTSNVKVSRTMVRGCARHGVTLSSNGEGRSGFTFTDCYLALPGSGDGFHIETDGLDRNAAYAALAADPDISPTDLGLALKCVQNVLLERCFAEGNIGVNGAANWTIRDCTIRPEPGGIGGGIRATEAPGGLIDSVQQRVRQSRASSSAKGLSLIGALTRNLVVSDWSVEHLPTQLNEVTPVVTSRIYGGAYQGWPSKVSIQGVVSVPPGGTLVGVHSGTEWVVDVTQRA